MTKGWMKFDEPTHLERALARAINKILASNDCINHCVKLASLCNAWVNCRRLRIDT